MLHRVSLRRATGAVIVLVAAAALVSVELGTRQVYAATATVSGCTESDLTSAISAAGPGGTVDYVVDCTGLTRLRSPPR